MPIKTSNHRETLTSRQRLMKSLNHEEPDRIPIDLGGNQTGIHKIAYQALLKTDGVDLRFEDKALHEVVQFSLRRKTPCNSLPGHARRCWSGFTSIPGTSPPKGRIVLRARSCKIDATAGCGTI